MRRIRPYLLLALAGLLSASLLFSSCDKDAPVDEETPPVTDNATTEVGDTLPESTVSYKVTVQKADGTPASEDHPELEGCVPVDARLAELLQTLMDKYTFAGVDDSWAKLCYYYQHMGA